MKLVEAARKYRGVKFCHRGRLARALDCAGLIWLAYKDCGVELPDFRLYSREPKEDGLTEYVAKALGDPVTGAPKAGDVIVLKTKVEPHHLAIVFDYPFGGLAMIHACGEAGRVVEHRLSPDILSRVTSVFRRPV